MYPWEYVIIDEGHIIKNMDSRLAKEMKSIKSENRLIMTGTPLQNNIKELFSLLNYLLPEFFSEISVVGDIFEFQTSEVINGITYSKEEREEINIRRIHKLHAILKPFMLRRIKDDVLKELPKKTEYQIGVNMTKLQREVYMNLLIERKPSHNSFRVDNMLS
jgi:ATP-dependent DNA helicase